MKYFTGTRKRSRNTRNGRKSLDGEKSTDDGNQQTLQMSANVESRNPRQRGRKRANSSPQSEDTSKAKKSKFLDSKTKSNVSDDDSENLTITSEKNKTASRVKHSNKTSSATSRRARARARNAASEPTSSASVSPNETIKSRRKSESESEAEEVGDTVLSRQSRHRGVKAKPSSNTASSPKEDIQATKTKAKKLSKTAKSGSSRNSPQRQPKTLKQVTKKGKQNRSESDSETEGASKAKKTKPSNRKLAPRKKAQKIVSSFEELLDSAFEDNSGEVDVTSSDGGSDEWQSDREFLQQQVNLLMTPFESSDCSELHVVGKGTKRQQKSHIPQDIVSKSLRKLNYKVEDELLKTLNRQGQRRIIQQIQEIRNYCLQSSEYTQKGDGTDQSGDEDDLETLKQLLESSEEELNGLKDLKEKAMKIASLIDEVDAESLSTEIKQTNKLLKKIQDKIKKQGISDFAVPVNTTIEKGTFGHQEIVNKLFPK